MSVHQSLKIIWVIFAYAALSWEFCPGQSQSVNFTHLLREDGLPIGGVNAIGQDLRGNIWIATEDGLRRYDGYEMRSLRHESAGAGGAGLRQNTVNALTVDATGRVWQGTDAGLYFLNPDTLQSHLVDSSADAGMPIRALAQEPEGAVWMGGADGLYKLAGGVRRPAQISDKIAVCALHWDGAADLIYVGGRGGEVLRLGATGEWQRVFSCGASVTAMFLDSEGGLWIGTQGDGVIYLKDGTEKMRLAFSRDGASTLGLPSNDITCLLEDSDQRIWIGTGNGLARYDPRTGVLSRYAHDPDDSRSLPTNEIHCLFEDQRKVLWVGHRRGTSRFPIAQRDFIHIKHRLGDPTTLSHDSVFGMLEDSKGRFWVGTEGGLNLRDAAGRFRSFTFPATDGRGRDADFIYVIHEAPDGKLWLGTRGSGLVVFDPETESFEGQRRDPHSTGGVPHNSITAIATDRHGMIWVGSVGGIVVFDAEGTVVRRYQNELGNQQSLASDAVSDLLVTPSGTLFVATEDAGVLRFDEGSDSFQPLAGLASAKVTELSVDRAGLIWIGMLGGGVQAYDPRSQSILHHFHHRNSNLPDSNVFGIIQDRKKFHWFSTSSGLARLDLATRRFRTFDLDDGVQSMIFHPKAVTADAQGNLYFGGVGGYNQIDPADLPAARAPQQVVLTGLEVNGEWVDHTVDNPYLKTTLAMTPELYLKADNSRRLTFTFATLDYTTPTGARYRYRMSPIDPGWIDGGKRGRASYSALPPGSYTFEVQSSIDGNTWNLNSATFQVRVLPPWQEALWVRVLFAVSAIVLILSIAFAYFRAQSRKIRRQAELVGNDRNRAEAALASQLQRAMLVERATFELHDSASPSVFAAILDRLNEHFAANFCVLCEYSEDPEPAMQLLVERNQGLDSGFSLSRISPTNPTVQKVLSQRDAVYSGNIEEDESFAGDAPLLLGYGVRSLLAIKTSFQGSTNGVLFILHRDRYSWVAEDVHLMQTVADQIGVNIAHHRLTEADKRQKAELEKAREVAESASQAKSDFLAKMSHELRTPLSSILGFSEMLSRDVTITPAQRETLDIINGSGEHLLQTINDILDMSKIEAGAIEITKEAFDLREMLGSVEGMLRERAQNKHLSLEIDCADEVPAWIIADKVKVRQILVNLVGNAIKFTETGGVTIHATSRIESPGLVGAGSAAACRLHFEVVDTGAGISEEQIGKLFEKFTQTDSGRKSGEGTGLGLAISKSFVELMGGELTACSTVGVGTAFCFEILCNELPAEEVAKKKKTAPATGYAQKIVAGSGEFRVLIAEDQLPNRLLLRTILQQRGFKVFEAENGLEAVQAWKSCQPHMIFMDNEMPVMDGMTATREINRQAAEDGLGERPCIVSCTAYALDSFRDAAMEAGCVDFLAKPYKHEQLFELIGRHLPVEYELST